MFDDGTEEGLPEQARLIVGSSNLYDRSLQRNSEANVDHTLQPASNPEHAILWESALQHGDLNLLQSEPTSLENQGCCSRDPPLD